MKQIVKIVAVNLLILAVILVLVEIAARLFLPPNQPFAERAISNVLYEPSGLVQKNALPGQVVYEIRGGVTQTDKPMFRFNRDGLRNPDLGAKRPREVRVLIFGGSHVFDLNSYDHQGNPGFPRLLERQLRDSGMEVTVINAGIPGATSLELAGKLLYDFPRYQPDYIIFNSTWNDLKWIMKADTGRQVIRSKPYATAPNPLVEKVGVWDDLLGFSVTYRKLRDAWYRYRLKGAITHREDQTEEQRVRKATSPTAERSDPAEGLRIYGRIARSFVLNCRMIGAKPVIALEERYAAPGMTERQQSRISYDMVSGLHNHDDLLQLFERCDTTLLGVARDLNVPTIDLRMEMRGSDRYFDDHIHTTPEGSRYIARRYAELLPGILGL